MPPQASPARHRLALASLYAGVFLPPLDYFIVNLALPSIHRGLGASDAQIQLTVSAYALAYAVVLITGGRLGDLYGRRRIFMTGMAAFVAASALCGLAANGTMLVAGRVVQGVSAALITPQVLASIRTVFPAHQQARLMSIYGFVFGFASVAGQIGGGALIDLHPWGLDWRIVFLVNVPIGLLALAGAWRNLPESRAAGGVAGGAASGVIGSDACSATGNITGSDARSAARSAIGSSACSVGRDAASSGACSTARDAIGSDARSATDSATRSAARGAIGSGARSAACNAIQSAIGNVTGSATRSVTRDAIISGACSATGNASGSGARSAARNATGSDTRNDAGQSATGNAPRSARIDMPGTFALTLALVLLIYPLTVGRELHWPAWTFWSLAASVPVFAAFVAIETRIRKQARDPLVDLTVIRQPVVATGLLLAFLFYSIAAFFLTYGIYLQEGLGWTPLQSGLGLAPYAAGYLLAPLATPWLGRRIGEGLLPLGFGCLAGGFALCAAHLTHATGAAPGGLFYLGLLIAGTGQGIALPSLQRLILAHVDTRHAGMTAGATVAMLYIGAAFATACIAGAFFSALGHASGPAFYPAAAYIHAAYARAMRIGLEWMLAPLFAGLGLSVGMLRHLRHIFTGGASR